MDVFIEPGKYVVAVSGGVDSVALLDLLHGMVGLELTVAHFDHGIRPDSFKDREVAQKHASDRGLKFVHAEGRLGAGASESKARDARYEFLRKVQKSADARAIITAHHQDDLLETAIINILRGTGRKGLSSLTDRPDIRRPILHLTKANLYEYATKKNLAWREDHTNADTAIIRNYVRHIILPRLGPEGRKALLEIVQNAQTTNSNIDNILSTMIQGQSDSRIIDRHWFVGLPYLVAKEVLATWLRSHDVRNFVSKTIERIVVAAKVLPSGKTVDIDANNSLRINKDTLALTSPDR